MTARTKKAPPILAVGKTPEEKALMAEIAAMLPDPLTPADGLAFNLLATKVAEWLAMNHVVREVGVAQASDRSGVRHLSPEARREAEVFAEVVQLCKEFGLTPLSRAKLAARMEKEPAAVSPVFAGFISADPGKADER